jgi:hypothetical protein
MNLLRKVLSWSPVATGIAALVLLYLFDHWIFTRFFHALYWQWYLKNGSLIGLVSAILLRIWGSAADKHPALISAHPLAYLGAWLQFIGLPVYALGTQLKSNRDKSLSRSVAEGIFSAIVIAAFLVPAIVAWFIVIVPAQYLIYFLCGAPVRFAMKSDRIPMARLTRGGPYLEIGEAGKSAYPLFTAVDIKNPVSLIRKLAEPRDKLAEYLHEQLSATLLQELKANKDSQSPSPQLQQSLVAELNELLKIESLYDPERFATVRISTKTLNKVPATDKMKKRSEFNRALLEEAYPDEIVPSLPEEAADGWWDASFGRNPVSMTNALATLLLWVLQRVLF